METHEQLRLRLIAETRQKVSASVSKDQLVIQCTHTLADTDKIINMLAKRLREWYSLYLPELDAAVYDHAAFAQLVAEKTKDELIATYGITQTMGAKIAGVEIEPMRDLARTILSLSDGRERLKNYLESAMQDICPNTLAITGPLIGAKLLAQAGSLKRLAILPASTVQLLGAEKALFQHLTKKTKVPKYGILINHPLVQDAKRDEKGKTARALASKISLAAKIDFFRGPDYKGLEMKQELDRRFHK